MSRLACMGWCSARRCTSGMRLWMTCWDYPQSIIWCTGGVLTQMRFGCPCWKRPTSSTWAAWKSVKVGTEEMLFSPSLVVYGGNMTWTESHTQFGRRWIVGIKTVTGPGPLEFLACWFVVIWFCCCFSILYWLQGFGKIESIAAIYDLFSVVPCLMLASLFRGHHPIVTCLFEYSYFNHFIISGLPGTCIVYDMATGVPRWDHDRQLPKTQQGQVFRLRGWKRWSLWREGQWYRFGLWSLLLRLANRKGGKP